MVPEFLNWCHGGQEGGLGYKNDQKTRISQNWLAGTPKFGRNTQLISYKGYPTVKELGPNSTWYPSYKIGAMGVGRGGSGVRVQK